jgi:hypothetical protein
LTILQAAPRLKTWAGAEASKLSSLATEGMNIREGL